jgi:hypothetical protein
MAYQPSGERVEFGFAAAGQIAAIPLRPASQPGALEFSRIDGDFASNDRNLWMTRGGAA